VLRGEREQVCVGDCHAGYGVGARRAARNQTAMTEEALAIDRGASLTFGCTSLQSSSHEISARAAVARSEGTV
jgi:hypothetical protein